MVKIFGTEIMQNVRWGQRKAKLNSEPCTSPSILGILHQLVALVCYPYSSDSIGAGKSTPNNIFIDKMAFKERRQATHHSVSLCRIETVLKERFLSRSKIIELVMLFVRLLRIPKERIQNRRILMCWSKRMHPASIQLQLSLRIRYYLPDEINHFGCNFDREENLLTSFFLLPSNKNACFWNLELADFDPDKVSIIHSLFRCLLCGLFTANFQF